MAAGASVLLHFVDSPLYIGYSRFNLFALPLREALACVDGLASCSRLYVAGLENDYPFAFYLRRHSPEVRMQDRACIEDTRHWIAASFEQAADYGADAVLVVTRRRGRMCPEEREQGCRRVWSVRNARGNRIDIFQRSR